MKTKIGINGFGRIGRQVLKAIKKYHGESFDVVAINDLYGAEDNARLFKYDSNYGIYPGSVEVVKGNLIVDGDEIKVLSERDPRNLPWKELGVDMGAVLDLMGDILEEDHEIHILVSGAEKVLRRLFERV